MDITVLNNDDQQQLIPLSAMSKENSNLTSQPEDDATNHSATETQEVEHDQDFLTRLIHFVTNIHLPHLSDRLLRIIFLLFITLIGLTSFTIALLVGSSLVQFKHQCPLYASFEYQLSSTRESNWTMKINPLTEKFSSQSTCDFCTFSNVFIFIFCIITGFFFILFNGDQRIVTKNDQCLIIPWFPMSLILGLFSLVNASILTNGVVKFCSAILSKNIRLTSCRQLNDIYFEQYPNVSSLFSYTLIAIIFSWIQLIFFIGIITILTIRLGSSIDLSSQHKKRSVNQI